MTAEPSTCKHTWLSRRVVEGREGEVQFCLDCGLDDPLTTCTCCGATEGVERDGNEGVAVDPISGLCLYCQPCPYCGRTGMACDDTRGPGACDTTEDPDQPRLPPCGVCGENLAPGHLRSVPGPLMYEKCPGGQPFDWRSVISGVSL